MDVDQTSKPVPILDANDDSLLIVSPYSNVDIYKQIENLALQTADLQEKNNNDGHHVEERPTKKRKLTDELAEENNNNTNAKRQKRNLPEAIFRVIEEQEDFVPFFLRPKAYIRYKENPFAEIIDEDDIRVEYELDSDDEEYLIRYNKKVESDQKEALKINNEEFEHVVDICEKEAFKLTMDKLKENEIEAAHKVCTVCKDGSSDDNNQIIFCDGCDMAVHQACYGVRSIPEGTWFCELCDVGIGPDQPCKFCGQTGGAQKRTAANRIEYVHVQCALWLPECHFKEDDCHGLVYYRKEIDKDRYRLQCNICNKRVGAPIQCMDKKCFTSFHITCAQDKCYVLETEESEQGVDFFAWCPKHTPPHLKEKREKMLKDAEKREQSRKRAEVVKKQEEQTMMVDPKQFEHEKYCGGLQLDKVKRYVKFVQPQTCGAIFRYWAEKRKRRRGLPLIKRFQPSVLKLAPPPPRLEDMSQQNMIQGQKVMTTLREKLEKQRLLLHLVVKREKAKQRLMHNQVDRFEKTMLPENIRWRNIISALEAEDTSTLFIEPVSTHLAPDYYQVIAHPMSFYDIKNKIANCEYKTDDEFWADIDLIFKNAKEYNKDDTFVHEEAVRLEHVAASVKKEFSESVPIIKKTIKAQVSPMKKPVSTKPNSDSNTNVKINNSNNNNNNTNNINIKNDEDVMMTLEDQILAPIDQLSSSFVADPLTGVNVSFPNLALNTSTDLNLTSTNMEVVNESTNLSLNYGKFLTGNNDGGAEDLNASDWTKLDTSMNIDDLLNTSTNRKISSDLPEATGDFIDLKLTDDAVNGSTAEQSVSAALMTPPGSAKKGAASKKSSTAKSPTSKSPKTAKKPASEKDEAKPGQPSPVKAASSPVSKEKSANFAAVAGSPKSENKSNVRSSPRTNKKAQSDNTPVRDVSIEETRIEKKEASMEIESEKKPDPQPENNSLTKTKAESKKSIAGSVSDKKKTANKEPTTPAKNSTPAVISKNGNSSKSGEENNKEIEKTVKNTPSKSSKDKKSSKSDSKAPSSNNNTENNDNSDAKNKSDEKEDPLPNGNHETTPKKSSPKKNASPKSSKKSDPKSSNVSNKKADSASGSKSEPKTPQKKADAKNTKTDTKDNNNNTKSSPNAKKSEPKTPAKTPSKKNDAKTPNNKTKSTS